MPADRQFSGFEQPNRNYYRIPNSWFDFWAWARERLETHRVDGIIKWLEFLLKHSWGFLNFDVHVRLTTDEFQHGRRTAARDGGRGARMDRGTGLSTRTLIRAPQQLLALGVIERHVDRSDGARVKHWYLPRLRQDDAPPAPDVPFGGFDYPESNYFPIPFEWTDITHDIHSAVEILAAEYLMRHTFGWRDAARWLTPTEIASGRRRGDGALYDAGIQYPRDNVAVACEALVERGLLVWRPAERAIVREEREYALRMRSMLVEEGSGRWLGAEEESKTLRSESKTLTGESKTLTGESKTLAGESKTLSSESKTRSDNNTSTKQQTTPQSTPPPPTPSAAVVALGAALTEVGVAGRKRQEILALADPPSAAEVYAWVYWAYAQDWATANPVGAAIQQLLLPEARHHPPEPFLRFGQEHGSAAAAARALLAAYRLDGHSTPPSAGDIPLADEWQDHFGHCYPDQLPLPNPAAQLWLSERAVLQTGVESPPTPDVRRRWDVVWREFTVRRTSGPEQVVWRDAAVRLLGRAAQRLVLFVADPLRRVELEAHRAELEARLGEPLQLTAIDLTPVPAAPPAAAQSEPERLWGRVLAEASLSLEEGVVRGRFMPCVPLAFSERTLTVRAPTDAIWCWLSGSLRTPLARAAARASPELRRIRLLAEDGQECEIELATFNSGGHV